MKHKRKLTAFQCLIEYIRIHLGQVIERRGLERLLCVELSSIERASISTTRPCPGYICEKSGLACENTHWRNMGGEVASLGLIDIASCTTRIHAKEFTHSRYEDLFRSIQ